MFDNWRFLLVVGLHRKIEKVFCLLSKSVACVCKILKKIKWEHQVQNLKSLGDLIYLIDLCKILFIFEDLCFALNYGKSQVLNS